MGRDGPGKNINQPTRYKREIFVIISRHSLLACCYHISCRPGAASSVVHHTPSFIFFTPHLSTSFLIIPKVYNKTMTTLSVVNVMGRQSVRRFIISSTTNSSVLLSPSQHGVISVGLKLHTLDKRTRNSSTLPRAKGRLETDATRMPPATSCGIGTKTDIAANVSEDNRQPVDRSEVRVRMKFAIFKPPVLVPQYAYNKGRCRTPRRGYL